jgi:hypothetical protein
MSTTFDKVFAAVVRITGWGMGVYVVLAHKVDGTQTLAIIFGFIGFELVSRARDKKLPLIEERKKNERTDNG